MGLNLQVNDGAKLFLELQGLEGLIIFKSHINNNNVVAATASKIFAVAREFQTSDIGQKRYIVKGHELPLVPIHFLQGLLNVRVVYLVDVKALQSLLVNDQVMTAIG